MPSEDWPTLPVQRALLRSFANWLNRGKAGVYIPAAHGKLVRFNDDQLNLSVDLFLQEQGDGIRREVQP